MSGHTDGPWTWEGPYVSEQWGPSSIEVRGREGRRWVATCLGQNVGVAAPEMEANARLIASAPDLLEAAEAVMKTDTEPCTCGEAPYEPCSYCAPFDKLRAAIAKAKGEEVSP